MIGAEHRADDRALVRIAHRDGEQVGVVGGAGAVLLGDLDAQLGGDRERVDVVQALVRRAERAAQRRGGEQARARVGELPRGGDLDARDRALRRAPSQAGRGARRPAGTARARARSSSGTNGRLSACATGWPPSAATTCSATTTPARSWASAVEPARCGVSRRLGASRSGESAGSGSLAKTSSAAPASRPERSAVDERGLVDERSARGVDEQRARPQQREARASISPRVASRDRQVQADDVGHLERRLDRLGLLGARARPCARRSRSGS